VMGSEAANPDPLVLYDADCNLRLQVGPCGAMFDC
jgi:hypothetical protein